MVPTFILLVLHVFVSHKEQQLFPHTTLTDWFCVTEMDDVYCAVRTEFLYKTITFSLQVSMQYSKEIFGKILLEYGRKTADSTSYRSAISSVGISFHYRPPPGPYKWYVETKLECIIRPDL
jgi:hypothetical protein